MRIKCPSCFAEFDLVAALESEAGRELALIFASQPREVSAPLAAYLSLFRSASRALSWDRALKLTQEVQVLAAAQTVVNEEQRGKADPYLLSRALTKTVEVLREKQSQGGWRPLGNHNYLKQVLRGIQEQHFQPESKSVAVQPIRSSHSSQTAKSLNELQALIHD